MTATSAHELQAELRARLVDILVQVDDLADLTAVHAVAQPRGRGFFTHTARAEMNALIVSERHSQISVDPKRAGLIGVDQDGHEYLYGSGADAGLRTGPTKAPGNLKAIAAGVELHDQLRTVCQLAVRRLYVHGICARWIVLADATIRHQGLYLAALVRLLDDADLLGVDLLADITGPLTETIERAGAAVYGETQTGLDAPCPWCGRQTLVMFWARPTNSVEADFVRCDRDPRGHYHPCTCDDPLCACKQRPVAFRHAWVNRPGETTRNTLGWLKGRLDFNRRNQKEPR
jgi:hypothetical protein